MNRSDVKALHYITHIANLGSILQNGILCHNKAKKIECESIADPQIQERRNKVIPGGKAKLHDYANLYFNARNPMMFKRKNIDKELAVLRIDSTILDESGVVISDGNASSDYVGFYPSPEGLKRLEKDLVFAKYWTHPNPFIAYTRKSAICAEVLVPDRVPPRFIAGICVSCKESYQKVVTLLEGTKMSVTIEVTPNLFFQ